MNKLQRQNEYFLNEDDLNKLICLYNVSDVRDIAYLHSFLRNLNETHNVTIEELEAIPLTLHEGGAITVIREIFRSCSDDVIETGRTKFIKKHPWRLLCNHCGKQNTYRCFTYSHTCDNFEEKNNK